MRLILPLSESALTIRYSVTSSSLEDSLILAPLSHQSLFAARNTFDIVVIYDRSSVSIPTAMPLSATFSDAQRVLWQLMSAIYDNDFTKNLKRAPVLLTGGWEAWEREVGERSMVHAQGSVPTSNGRDQSVDEFGRLEARKAANRKAVVSPTDAAALSVQMSPNNVSPLSVCCAE